LQQILIQAISLAGDFLSHILSDELQDFLFIDLFVNSIANSSD